MVLGHVQGIGCQMSMQVHWVVPIVNSYNLSPLFMLEIEANSVILNE